MSPRITLLAPFERSDFRWLPIFLAKVQRLRHDAEWLRSAKFRPYRAKVLRTFARKVPAGGLRGGASYMSELGATKILRVSAHDRIDEVEIEVLVDAAELRDPRGAEGHSPRGYRRVRTEPGGSRFSSPYQLKLKIQASHPSKLASSTASATTTSRDAYLGCH